MTTARPWTLEEDGILRQHYATMRSAALAELLGRPLPGMYKRAAKLGLSKSQVYADDHKPHNYAPIGTTRTSGRNSYLMVKVRDGGWPDAWYPQHYLTWEAVHGAVPVDHVLTFKDGNVENTAVENLELIAKADWIKRYIPEHTLPPEVAEIIRLKGALTRAINDKLRGNDDQPE